jgi:beta-phosphoglucomutase-like phosphatase (HAD superfamily)
VEFVVDAVLFDMDGVLVDSSAAVERHWRSFAIRHQIDPEWVRSGIHGRRSPEIIAEHVPAADQVAELAWMQSLQIFPFFLAPGTWRTLSNRKELRHLFSSLRTRGRSDCYFFGWQLSGSKAIWQHQ